MRDSPSYSEERQSALAILTIATNLRVELIKQIIIEIQHFARLIENLF